MPDPNEKSDAWNLRRLMPARFRRDGAIVPVVRLNGAIGIAAGPLKPGMTLAGVAGILERAFKTKRAKAVAIAINSPGGSAVQAHLIYQRIRHLAVEKKLPVIAFIEDAGASGGYMIACAADEIICDPSSIVGSIGVIGASFGFPGLLAKLGVERRIYKAGENKAMLDPFLPEDPEEVARIQAIQSDVHARFIALVRERRGDKLKGPDLFTGAFWAGDKAVEFGLADGLGELRQILRARFGEKVKLPVMAERSLFRRISGMQLAQSASMTAGLTDDILSTAQERGLWARLGL